MPTGAAWPAPVSWGRPGSLPGGRRGHGSPPEFQLPHGLGVAGASVSLNCGLSRELGDGKAPPGPVSGNRATVSLCQAELLGLTAEEVYLVHDDLDKPLGKLALKLGGSAG